MVGSELRDRLNVLQQPRYSADGGAPARFRFSNVTCLMCYRSPDALLTACPPADGVALLTARPLLVVASLT